MAKTTPTPQSILTDVKNGRISPVYYLMGEEAYYIDFITDELLKLLMTEADREFDLSVVYGKDTDMRQIISLARQYPMLAKYKVVLVKECQDIRDSETLLMYLEKPMPSTVVIFNHKNGTLDKRKKLPGEIERNGVLYESKKLYENELPGWISGYARQIGLGVDDRTADLLSGYLGSDLSRIVNELEKLKISMPAGETRVTAELVERNIGISKEYNDFELQAAIVSGNVLKANTIAHYYSKNPRANPLIKTIALITGFFSNLMLYHYLVDKTQASVAAELGIAPFRVREYSEAARRYNALKTMQIISLLRTFDAKSKGFESKSIPDAELLKELLFKIMH